MHAGLFPQDAGEAISFEAFMAFALHNPQSGYYARSISSVGKKGDFTTTAEISPALAKAIAAWAAREMRATNCRHLIELGPGTGKLAAAVWQRLPRLLRWRSSLHLVESSASLRTLQQQRSDLRHVIWHATIEEALSACDGNACLYSNEFFDAFPVKIFERQAVWRELHLKRDDQGRVIETFHDPQQLPESTIWSIDLPPGQRVEIHSSVQQWLARLERHWHRGAMLAIDYGDQATELYHRRPNGSIRAYLAQQRIEGAGIYQNIGRQDLTCDVNFSDLSYWTKNFVEPLPLLTQSVFLQPFCKIHEAGDQAATDPYGAGSAFKVWQCRRTRVNSRSQR